MWVFLSAVKGAVDVKFNMFDACLFPAVDFPQGLMIF